MVGYGYITILIADQLFLILGITVPSNNDYIYNIDHPNNIIDVILFSSNCKGMGIHHI